MKVGSLFSGIGGLELGLERAGMTVSWQVECDPYASKVLAKHWPNVPRFIDVREVGKHNLSHVNIICGGFPCQDISVAGRREGITGKRSGLWKEFARIIDEIRPAFVLIENVPALRSRGLSVVLGDLAALGYDAEWDCLSASSLGAPHVRDRIFVVANANRSRQLQPQGGIATQRRRVSHGRSAMAHTEGLGGELRAATRERQGRFTGVGPEGWPEPEPSGWWATEPNVGRVAHGVPSRVDRLRCLGNAVVPQVAEHIGRMILGGLICKSNY